MMVRYSKRSMITPIRTLMKTSQRMTLTAYHKWLIQQCSGDMECIALQLAHDCFEQNQQALGIMQATGAPVQYNRHSYYRAAKLILTENEKQQNCTGEHTSPEHKAAANR